MKKTVFSGLMIFLAITPLISEGTSSWVDLLSFPKVDRGACQTAAAGDQAGIDPGSWLDNLEKSYAEIESYTAVFHKQERLEEKLGPEETILLKFKKPFKVYMKWIQAPHKGREALYVEGWNENRVKVHEGGLLGLVTVDLDPRGRQAMRGNRHPITDTGLGNLIKILGDHLRKARDRGELELKDHGEKIVYGRKAQMLEFILPKSKSEDYYCHRALIHVDLEIRLPIKVQTFDADDRLMENYGFENLNPWAGLTDADFDPRNPAYKF